MQKVSFFSSDSLALNESIPIPVGNALYAEMILVYVIINHVWWFC